MSSVWDMILPLGSTIKVSPELPVATRHRRDMTEKLLKATLNQNTHTHALASLLILCFGFTASELRALSVWFYS